MRLALIALLCLASTAECLADPATPSRRVADLAPGESVTLIYRLASCYGSVTRSYRILPPGRRVEIRLRRGGEDEASAPHVVEASPVEIVRLDVYLNRLRHPRPHHLGEMHLGWTASLSVAVEWRDAAGELAEKESHGMYDLRDWADDGILRALYERAFPPPEEPRPR